MTPDLFKFIIVMVKAGVLLSIFVFCGLTVFMLVKKIVKDTSYNWVIFAISLIVGPILLSWLLTVLLMWTPGNSREFYIFAPLVPFTLLFLYGIATEYKNAKSYWKLPRSLTFSSVENFFWVIGYGVLIIGVFSIIVGVTAVTPIHGNDAIEYQLTAQAVATARDANIYPILDPNVSNGFSAPWSHPMGYINLLTYSYLLQGFTDTSGVARFVSPYFALTLTFLLVTFAGFKRLLAGILAGFLMLSTPVFLHLVLQAHIDPARLATLTAATAAVWIFALKMNWKIGVFAGLACGCAMFIHSIGILTLPLLVPAFLIVAKSKNLFKLAGGVVLMVGFAIPLLIPRYFVNFQKFGSLVTDSVIIWESEAIGVEHARLITRYMETTADKFYHGVLMGVTNIDLFGWCQIIFFLALAMFLFRLRRYARNPFKALWDQNWRNWGDPALITLMVSLGYIAMMILTVALGSDLAIKNARYVMTMHPFMIIFSARVFTQYFFPETAVSSEISEAPVHD